MPSGTELMQAYARTWVPLYMKPIQGSSVQAAKVTKSEPKRDHSKVYGASEDKKEKGDLILN